MTGTPEPRAGVTDVDLSETTALVTGSTSGIGRGAALALGRLGARVFVHGRDADAGQAVVTELDLLVNNAGALLRRDELTDLGVEKTFHVDHLSPYLLTAELLDHLADDARVACCASCCVLRVNTYVCSFVNLLLTAVIVGFATA